MSSLRILGLVAAVVGLGGAYALSQGCDSQEARAPMGPPLDAAAAAAARICGSEGELSCPAGQRCAVACNAGSAAPRCEADPGTGAVIGEACDGLTRCRIGVCVGGNLRGPSQQCLAFCTSKDECSLGQVCETVSLTYACDGGQVVPVAVKLCRWK